MNAGVELNIEGRLVEAVAEFDEANRLGPQYAQAYADLTIAKTILDLDFEANEDAYQAMMLGFERTPLKDLI